MAVETLISGAAASVSLLESLVRLLQTAAQNPNGRLTTAEVIKKLPGEAFSVAKQISAQLTEFRTALVAEKVDLKTPLASLAMTKDYWISRKDRISRQADARVEGLKNALLTLVDDFVAVASCADSIHVVSASFEQSHEAKRIIRAIADPARPIGGILDELIDFTDKRIAALGDLGREPPPRLAGR